MSDVTRYEMPCDLAVQEHEHGPAEVIRLGEKIVRASDYGRDTQALQRDLDEHLSRENIPKKYIKLGGVTYAVYGTSSIDCVDALTARLAACRQALTQINQRAYGQADKVALIVLMDWIRETAAKALAQEGNG